jgi:acetyltransferase
MTATGPAGSECPEFDAARFLEIWCAPEGTEVTIRPINARDAALEVEFLSGLSQETLYQRVLSSRKLLPGELKRLIRIDYVREMALLATIGAESAEKAVGVARYVGNADGTECEFAIVIADAWQGKGLGAKLLGCLADIARATGFQRIVGSTFATNEAMKRLARRLGFTTQRDPSDSTVTVLSKSL